MERARPVIFYRSDCPKSTKALEYLEARRVGYDAVEVQDNEASLHRLEAATGQTRTPTLCYENESLRDFDVPELAAFLKKYQLASRPGEA